MSHASTFLLALCSFRDFQIVDLLIGIGEALDCSPYVIAEFPIELNVADVDQFGMLVGVDHVVLGDFLQHCHIPVYEVTHRRVFDVAVVVGTDEEQDCVGDILVLHFIAVFLGVIGGPAEKGRHLGARHSKGISDDSLSGHCLEAIIGIEHVG